MNRKISRCGKIAGRIRASVVIVQGYLIGLCKKNGIKYHEDEDVKVLTQSLLDISTTVKECDSNKKLCGKCRFGEFFQKTQEEQK